MYTPVQVHAGTTKTSSPTVIRPQLLLLWMATFRHLQSKQPGSSDLTLDG
jgi:hypothetical protein